MLCSARVILTGQADLLRGKRPWLMSQSPSCSQAEKSLAPLFSGGGMLGRLGRAVAEELLLQLLFGLSGDPLLEANLCGQLHLAVAVVAALQHTSKCLTALQLRIAVLMK